MKRLALATGILAFGALPASAQEPLRVICIEAHPDDCDGRFGGTAALYARSGHAVKIVALTNGDAGHQSMGGGALAMRRRAEGEEAGRRIGAEYQVLDNHDGELLPTLEVRRQVIRAIREWNADIVFSLRPNDYHPDHRYAGVLVMDAAYMVTVPNIVTDVPSLRKNPVFFYMADRFTKPTPHRPDVVISIDPVVDAKIDMLDAHESQMYEWLAWHAGLLDEVPDDPEDRKEWLYEWRMGGREMKPEWREALRRWYGDAADDVKHAEAFELAEYGSQPSPEEMRRLFPFVPRE